MSLRWVYLCVGGADVCEEGPLRNKQEKQQLPRQLLLQMGIACLHWSHLLSGSSSSQFRVKQL